MGLTNMCVRKLEVANADLISCPLSILVPFSRSGILGRIIPWAASSGLGRTAIVAPLVEGAGKRNGPESYFYRVE